MKRIFKITFVSLIGAASILTSCTSKTPSNDDVVADNGEPVRVIKLEEKEINRIAEYTATLKAWEEVHIAPATPLRIENFYTDVSQNVTKGQLLARMDRTQTLQAEIQFKNLEMEFERAEILIKSGSYSQQAYDQLKAQYDVAKTSLEYLRTNTEIKAPFSGIVSGKYYENGEMYSASPIQSIGKAAILSLVQIDNLKAVIHIPEGYFPLIKDGMTADIISDLYPTKEFKGKVNLIHPIIDEHTRTFEVEVAVNNKAMTLRPGMFARVFLDLGKDKALIVPDFYVLKMQGTNERYIFLNDNGVAKRVTVKIGARYDDQVEILSPEIKVGDEIVCEGQGRLLDKSVLKIVK